MSASDIVRVLRDNHAYLTLVYGLRGQDGEDKHKLLRTLLNEVAAFINSASSNDLLSRGRQLTQLLDRAIEMHALVLPHRKPVHQIAQDFRELQKESDVWRFGVPYGWLVERFEPSGIGHPLDLPPHAKVGVGTHAGNASVEEVFLLEDAYFLLARAEAGCSRMLAAAAAINESQTAEVRKVDYKLLAVLNAEVGTFSRLSVVSAAAFVEAFVNSVGWREATLRSDLPEDVRTQLKGTHKGRYLSLEAKLERYPKLIRLDGAMPIVLSDARQAKEPFVSFLAETKRLRDASLHYAPEKAAIWRPPQDWLASAQRATEHGTRVAECFWTACYPGRGSPEYLDNLCHARFLDRAREHVKRADDPASKAS